MQLDFETLGAGEGYRWLVSTVTPRPIAWVSSLGADGSANLAPFSFFQVVCDEPPTLMISISNPGGGRRKDTLRNVEHNGELVIHLVSDAHAALMNATSAALPHGDSEFDAAGIACMASTRVNPPRIADAAVAFECRVAGIMPYPAVDPSSHLVFARVLLAHIDDRVLADERHVDPRRLDLVGRLGGSLYTRTRDIFAMVRPA